ncbi:cell adhesion molecule 4-like isoform X1 [Melanotaenia boesemani]|uniref:cell adhesion molecule 4-like isoform X1 n=1 Tax=Melanotaenia boesemani TaxID=1250792 RepID=UPI001C05BA65|nr:cell adhesion molecule 4-like isoform X1 [Melanotaenia boesemani]
MNTHSTPGPWIQTSARTVPPDSELVTKIGQNGTSTSSRGSLEGPAYVYKTDQAHYNDTGDFAALIGGIVCTVLLLFICTIAVLLWCLSRQKGSYVTNETDVDDEDDDDDGNDGESVGSDTALQSKQPLTAKEED